MNTLVHQWEGLFPALITPYDLDGSIDFNGLHKLIRHLLDKQVNGFYVGGSTGEGLLQSLEERKRILEAAIKEIAGEVPVIAHVGAMDTATCVELAAYAEQIGAQAVSAVTPFYYKHRLPELKQHYLDIAAASELPVIVYHFPALTGAQIPMEFYADLSLDKRIAGVKFTSRDLFDLQQLMDACDDTFAVFNGHDECLIGGLAVGVRAAIGSTYHIMPDAFATLMTSFQAGDMDGARNHQIEVNRVIAELTKYDTHAFIREILRLQGVETGVSRKPMQRLSEEQIKSIHDFAVKQPCLGL